MWASRAQCLIGGLASQGVPGRCVSHAGSCKHIPIILVDINLKGIFTLNAGRVDIVNKDRLDQQKIKTLFMGKPLLDYP
jgi:hypothetical protein